MLDRSEPTYICRSSSLTLCRLQGQFSRLEHQSQSFYKRSAPHVLPGLTLHLPAGIRNTYYYDLVGNVSTSRLRTAPSSPIKSQKNKQYSVLELRPRYPLMGGWNYSFTLGWDSPLADSVNWNKDTGKYIAQIPIMTEIPTAVVQEAELSVVLPEGAMYDTSGILPLDLPFPTVMWNIPRHSLPSPPRQ